VTAWKELPKPATPGPWRVSLGEYAGSPRADVSRQETWAERAANAAAIAALPEWIEEAERRKAWLEWLLVDWPGEVADRIRSGEWPDGRAS
jgi:hypothetical protein